MKRAHRQSHILIWLILKPAIAGIIALAVLARPAAPMNDALPASIIEAPR